MRKTDPRHFPIWRRALLAVIAACGIATIVGSGGGALPDVNIQGCCQVPYVSVEPGLRTVTVGDTVSFNAVAFYVTAPVSYQWRRNGVDIAGATGTSYTLAGANLGDDGALFTVLVNAGNGSTSATATLQVSAYPAIVFADGEFATGNWSVAVSAVPAPGGPTATVTQAGNGGNPGAYRSIRYDMSAGPSSITLFHGATAAVYDPASQRAIYAIDASADCIKSGSGEVAAAVMLEQGGRRYQGTLQACTVAWARLLAQGSMRASDFVRVDGPTCNAGEACPDFGAGGAPLQFGLVTTARISTGDPAVALVQGVDNWKLSIWRR